MRAASATSWCRRWCAASTTTRAPPGSGAPPAWATSIFGGGRYDGLAEQIGGPTTPGVGFGAGLERLLEVVRPQPPTTGGSVLFAVIAEQAGGRACSMDDARAAGVTGRRRLRFARAKRMLELASKRGDTVVVIWATTNGSASRRRCVMPTLRRAARGGAGRPGEGACG